jgi:hypothetical protein
LKRLLSVGDKRKDWARVSAWALLSSLAKSHPRPVCSSRALTLRPLRPAAQADPSAPAHVAAAALLRQVLRTALALAILADRRAPGPRAGGARHPRARALLQPRARRSASRHHFSRSATPASVRRRRSSFATRLRSSSAACSRSCSVTRSGTSASHSSARRRRARSACACVRAAPSLSWPAQGEARRRAERGRRRAPARRARARARRL